jgi:uncharacterized protein DUF5666
LIRAVAVVVAVAALVTLAPGADAEIVHGTIVGLHGSSLTLRSDDGRTIRVDVTGVDRAMRASLAVGEQVTVSGDPGDGGQLAARYVQDDSSDPTRGGKLGGLPGPQDRSWERVRGTVTGVTGTTLTLGSDDGRTLTVDIVRVDGKVRATLAKGERVTVAGLRAADRSHFTAHYILKESAGEAASPPEPGGIRMPQK